MDIINIVNIVYHWYYQCCNLNILVSVYMYNLQFNYSLTRHCFLAGTLSDKERLEGTT